MPCKFDKISDIQLCPSQIHPLDNSSIFKNDLLANNFKISSDPIWQKPNITRTVFPFSKMITIQRKPIGIVLPNRQFIRWQHFLDRLTPEVLRQGFYIFPMTILNFPGDQIQWMFP